MNNGKTATDGFWRKPKNAQDREEKQTKKKHTYSSVMTHSKTVIQSTAGQEQASLSIVAKKSRWTTEGISFKKTSGEDEEQAAILKQNKSLSILPFGAGYLFHQD